jgi:hypothetical protein
MCDETGNLVLQGLGQNDGDLLAYPLVCVDIDGQPGVVFLNDQLRSLPDGFSPFTTHFQRLFLSHRKIRKS